MTDRERSTRGVVESLEGRGLDNRVSSHSQILFREAGISGRSAMIGERETGGEASGLPEGREGCARGVERLARAGEARAGDGEGIEWRPEVASIDDPFFSFCGQPVPIERGLARDLLGEPIRPGVGRRGRPMHIPSDVTRGTVREMRKAGCTQAAIAEALGISGPTLRLNYPIELGSGSTTWRRRAGRNSSREEPATGRRK